VFGAMGGLIGWQVSNLVGLSFSANLYINEAAVGAMIGLSLGAPLGATRDLLARSPLRAARGGLLGGAQGLIAGALGLPLGEFLFQAVGAGVLGRAAGWGIFGALIGLAEGVTGGTQAWKGALGGALGGAFGGALLEAGKSLGLDFIAGKALGLVLLGACVGALIALIVVLLSRAWLEVTSGKLKGTTFILDKFMSQTGPSAIVGSSPLKAEIALPDPDVEPQHAMLIGGGSHFSLKDMSRTGTYINGRKIEQARLANGQQMRMGNTTLRYHERR
jgi:hypothetical protein